MNCTEKEGFLIIGGGKDAKKIRGQFNYCDISYITPVYKNPNGGKFKRAFISNEIVVEFDKKLTKADRSEFLSRYMVILKDEGSFIYKFAVACADDNCILETANEIYKDDNLKSGNFVVAAHPNFLRIFSEETGYL